MKLKNGMIFICLILFILISISAVSSADNNTIVITENNNVDDDILSINDLNNDVLSETGDGSFAELNATLNGGTSSIIELTKNYTYSGSDKIKDGILISRNDLTVDGKGHTIDAKGQSRIFYVNSTNVTLKNIKFINGDAFSKSGGAIYGYGECLRVINCTFVNNNATWGGAIFSYPNSYSVFVSSTFMNNTAKYGGAIVAYHGIRQDFLYCNFISNRASDNGGALMIYGTLATTENPYNDVANVKGCLFTNNNAPEGEAISNYVSAIINLTDSIVLGSPETVVYSWGRMFTANNNWWGNTIDNRSVKPNVTSDIYVDDWLYLDLAINIESSSATLSLNNLYDGKSGVISSYSTSKLPSIEIELTSINATLDSDSAILDHSGKASVNYKVYGDCTITANYGDVVISKGFKSGSFEELQALFDNCDDEIINLEKDYVYTLGIDKTDAGVRIEKSNIIVDGNGHIINAAGKSRVIDIYARNVTLRNVVISGGNVYDLAGAGVKSGGMDIKFINCTFANNYADDGNGGSAIYIASRGTTILDCKFINNTQAYSSGGAVYCGEINVNIINSLFMDNFAKSRGGAVYVSMEGTSITNCTFKNNIAKEGGAIYDLNYDDNPTQISYCTFLNNVATSEDSLNGGGAICINTALVTNSVFNGNKAGTGAAIYSLNTKNSIEKCLFVNNTAGWNGVVFFYQESSVSDSIFVNNNLPLGGYLISNIYGNAKTNYNWYGNVWKNYNMMPDVTNLADMNNWLFLNLTDIVFDGDDSFSAKFNFFVYDCENDNFVEYDFNNLPLFDLNLSSQNLTIDKDTVSLGETFNANVDYYKGNLIAKYEDVTYTMPFKFQKETWIEANSTINLVVNKKVAINEWVHPFEIDYMPFLISSQRIKYVSSNSSIVKVDAKGKITALKVGVANVTITFNGYDVMGRDMYKPSNITVTVNVTRIPTNIKMIYDPPSIIHVGEQAQLICSLDPYTARGSLDYTSNDTSVATVTTGIIKGIKEGVVNITVSYAGNEKYAPSSVSFILVVSKRNSTITIAPEGNITIDVGSQYLIAVSSTPSNVELSYNTSNPDVAVFENDRIISVGVGLANITVSFAGNDKYLPSSAQLTVKVISYETHFDVDSTVHANVTDSMSAGAVLKDNENNTIIPRTNKVEYSSNDTNIVEIDQNGWITCIGEGKATINIRFLGQDKYLPSNASITVIVSVVPTKIGVADNIELHVDDKANINATLDYGNSRDLKYSTNDSSVVSVDRYGNLVAHKVGTALINITYPGTKKYINSSASVLVNVTKVPTKIEVGKTFSLVVGDNELLNATLNPMAPGNLTYSSSNESVVTIDSDGLVTAVGLGNAIITVSFEGDEKYASAREYVEITNYGYAIPTSIQVNDTVTLYAGNKTDIGAVLTPSNAGNLVYTSNDTSVATIDENGIITAIGEGKALISITLNKTNSKLQDNSANVTVNVLLIPTTINAMESVTVNLTENATIDYVFSHPEAGPVEFIISNPNVAVIENGAVIGKSVGNTTITIKFSGNRQYTSANATVKVNVVDVPVRIDVVDLISVNLTETAEIGASLVPGVAGSLVYVSSDVGVVGVDENGVVTARKVGEADITVSFAGNGKYRANSTKVHINVVDVPVRIDVVDLISVNLTETAEIGASLVPGVAGSLVYVSSDVGVVGVDENGVVTARKVGEADITVSFAGNGKYRANSTKVHIKVVDVKTEIEIPNTNISLLIDDTVNINATLNPSDAGNLKYVSNNPSVIVVDENGIITALKDGKAIVTVSYVGEGKYVSSSKNVTVTVSKIPTEILINSNLTMEIGEGLTIKPKLNPSIKGALTYSSSDLDIVEVDQTGFVYSASSGKANITISYAGDEKYLPSKAIIEVTVSPRPTTIEVNNNVTIGFGDSMDLGAVLKATYFTFDDKMEYESSDSSIVGVDDNGVITANKRGSAIITIKYGGKYNNEGILIVQPSNATVNVLVTTKTTKITVKNDKISLKVDDTANIDATLNRPEDGILTYISGNSAVAVVDANGRITAVGEGVANITVRYAGNDDYHDSSATVTVTVSKISSKIKVNISRTLKVDEMIDLGAVLQPVDATLTYISSNEAVATVDANGMVTGLKSGNAIITVKYNGDRKYTGSQKLVSVFVSRIATSISVDPIELYIGDTYQFENVITPAEAGDVEYISSDTEIADVDFDGFVTTEREGSVEILINYTGNYKYMPSNATVLVTVLKKEIPESDYKFSIDVRDELGRATFSIRLPEYVQGNFIVILDGDTYSTYIENGKASYTVDDLEVGKHKVTMRYGGSLEYSSIIKNDEFRLSPIKMDKNKNVEVYYGSAAKYTVHLTKNTKALQGKRVTFTVNGKKLYSNTNSKGYATVKVKLPKVKSYKITASFGRFKVSNKITVHLIVAKNVAVKKSAKALKIKVSLKKMNKKYLKGKKLTLKFNGKKFIAKTNKKGVATFTIKKNVYSKLKVGKKYTYKVIYSKDIVSKKITIKK